MNNEEAIKKYLEKIAKAEKHLARIEHTWTITER